MKKLMIPVGAFALCALAGFVVGGVNEDGSQEPYPQVLSDGMFPEKHPDVHVGRVTESGDDEPEDVAESGGGQEVVVVEGGVGSIRGIVRYTGGEKPAGPLAPTSDTLAECGAEMSLEDRSLILDADGKLANAVVTLKAKGYQAPVPTSPVIIDQFACRFEPHVQVVPESAPLRFKNSDGTSHNVHSYPKKNPAVNKNQAEGQTLDMDVSYAEVFKVACDIHPWMNMYVFVTKDTHYAVTNVAGEFTLENVPSGKYQLKLWHEKLGKEKVKNVIVQDGEVTELAFDWAD